MGGFPWKDLTAAAVTLVLLGTAWAGARGALDNESGALVNAAATAMAAAVVLAAAWHGWRHTASARTDVAFEGEWRTGLIRKVRARWIGSRGVDGRLGGEGKLAQDLPLGVTLQVDLRRAVPAASADRGTIHDAWERSGHGLVLTGTPGAGKSVQLLLLAERLLDDAERRPDAAVPVTVDLATWRPAAAPRRSEKSVRPFEDWLVAEIQARYRTPTGSTRTWLAQGKLIPFLDGLDEVAADRRARLFALIRSWLNDKDGPPAAWALGCRHQEYVELDPAYTLVTQRHTFWSVQPIDDAERVRFLRRAQETVTDDWGRVIDALDQGTARHLTALDADSPGVLATPLGLAIAVEAYRATGTDDQPSRLLDASGDRDALWNRYVFHRYSAGAAGTDDDLPKPAYSYADARRWLSTFASGRLGPGTEIDVEEVEPPGAGRIGSEFMATFGRLDVEGFIGVFAATCLFLSVSLGALVDWSDWVAAHGTSMVLLLAPTCVVALMAALLPRTNEFSFEIQNFRMACVAALVAVPGLLVIATGAFRLDPSLAHSIEATISRQTLFGFDLEVVTRTIRFGDWSRGALTGLATAAAQLVPLGAALLCLWMGWVVRLYRRRDPYIRPQGDVPLLHPYLWWLDGSSVFDDLSDRHARWVSRHLARRWWYYGSPWRWRHTTGLVPPPKEWERFLDWASHRGYLQRVGDRYVWIHETLRVWFTEHPEPEDDRETTAAAR